MKGWKKYHICDIMITYHNFAKTEESETMKAFTAHCARALEGGAAHG